MQQFEPYWSKMQVDVSRWDGYDKYSFYVRIGPPGIEYQDTPIVHQDIFVTRPTPDELVDHMFDQVKQKIKEYLAELDTAPKS